MDTLYQLTTPMPRVALDRFLRRVLTTAVAAAAATLLLSANSTARAQAPVAATPPAQGAKDAPKGPPAQGPGDPLGPDLFIAIRDSKPAVIKELLAKGAKTEAVNWLGLTPLHWAAGLGNVAACEALLDGGAEVNASCRFGNVLALAEMSGNPAAVRLLVARGAKISPERGDKITPVMTASGSGHVETLRLLLTLKNSAVNAADETGATALIHAARRGQTDAARLLLDSGANINAQDKRGRTALAYAAQNGYPTCVNLFVSRNAQVSIKDTQGDTALTLGTRYANDPAVTRALLRAGTKGTKNVGKTTEQRRADKGMTLAKENAAVSKPTAAEARAAAAKGLALIEKSTKTFSDRIGCVSCHHQGLGLMTTGLARKRNLPYDRALALAQTGLIRDTDDTLKEPVKGVIAHPETAKYVPGVDMGELAPAIAFSYSGLLAHDFKPGEIQQSITAILAGQQDADGKWGFALLREPMQSSVFSTTAMAIPLLREYLPADRAVERDTRIEKAKQWLLGAKAVTNEDRTWRLLGLKWAGATPDAVAKATADLLRAQRPDGGWAQLPPGAMGKDGGDAAFTRSDAYATGQALYALHLGGGIPVNSPAYQKGVRYLLRTQDRDGSWLVSKRAIPVNTYMDGGFPHVEAQYSSYNASCWATMALLLATPPAANPANGLAHTAAVQGQRK